MANLDSALVKGDRIGRYTVLRELGAGGMGVVYQAHDEDLERDVAVKVLPAAMTGNQERRARFLREARSAAAVSHRSIAVVHEVGEDGGRVFIAMELVRGETLATRIARGPLAPADATSVGLEIARGVAKAHEAGVLHRDLKPSNVMLDEDGGVKILDFGLAKRLDDEQADESAETVSALTEEGRVMGTPGYMAPEQAEGRALGPPADVFAIGTILYEMLTGEMAFGGRSTALRIAATLKDEPPALAEHAPDAPVALAELVHACLAKRPTSRPPDAVALASELEAIADDMPRARRITVQPPSTGNEGGSNTLATGDTVLAAAASTSSSPKRRFWPVLVLLPLLAAGLWWWGRAQSGASTDAEQDSESLAALLTRPGSQIACPLWTASGQKGPAGRLGAAAAAAACYDWMLLAGDETNKLTPAQLLALPLLPVDDFPAHPYVTEGARERSLEAAQKAPAMLDGHVELADHEFDVTVKLERAGLVPAPTAKAHHRVLVLAVHAAVRALGKQVGLAENTPLPEGLRELTACRDAGCFFDLSTAYQAVTDSDADRARACEALAKRDAVWAGSRARDCGHAERLEDGLPVWPVHLRAAIDALPAPGRAFWSSLLRLHVMKPETAAKEADEVRRLREKHLGSRIEVPLSVAEAVLRFRSGDPRGARPLLDRAYQVDPTDCTAREVASELALDLTELKPLGRAASSWCPESADNWMQQFSAERGESRDIELMRTAYYLRAGAMSVGVGFAGSLLAAGRVQEARLVASRYLAGDERERFAGSYLQARVDIASGQLAAGLEQLSKLLEKLERVGNTNLHGADWGAIITALEFGELVGRAEPIAELVLRRFVLAEPPPIDNGTPLVFGYVASFAPASMVDQAVARIEELTRQGKLWKLDEATPYLEGVRRFRAGDAKGAAEAWRPLVGKPVYRGFLRAEAFDAAGEAALASTVDGKDIEVAGSNATLCYAREAKRAAARGDHDTAQRYAKIFVNAWSTADVKVPAVDEMRPLAEGK